MAGSTFDFSDALRLAGSAAMLPVNPIGAAAQFFGPDIQEAATGALKEAWYAPGVGQIAIKGGRPVVWTGDYLRWQSPESAFKALGQIRFKEATGNSSPTDLYTRAAKLAGFNPTLGSPTRNWSGQDLTREVGSGAQGGGAQGGGAPPAAPPLPAPQEASASTIPQGIDDGYKDLIDYLKVITDPGLLARIKDADARRVAEQSILTSELSRIREEKRYGRDLEKENIQAWRNIEQEKIRANAIAQASIGAAMVSAFAPPNAQALSSTLQAAMAPYSSMKLS